TLPEQHSEELDQFLISVQRQTGMQIDQVEQAARAVLSALGESISGGQATALAQWLPPELAPELAQRHGQAQAFDEKQFLDLVAARTPGLHAGPVEQHVRGTLNALHAVAPQAEIDDTLAQLPRELAVLFS
ncbi:MAG: DUF2267 domain-containing protein, partial [Sciscionella sp.]